MPTTPKRHISGQPHIQPAPRPLSLKQRIGIAQKTSARRKDAKPATIDIPPWEKKGENDE